MFTFPCLSVLQFYLHRSRYPNKALPLLACEPSPLFESVASRPRTQPRLISSSPQPIVANSRYRLLARSLRPPPHSHLTHLPSGTGFTPDAGLTPFIDRPVSFIPSSRNGLIPLTRTYSGKSIGRKYISTNGRTCSPVMIARIRHVK